MPDTQKPCAHAIRHIHTQACMNCGQVPGKCQSEFGPCEKHCSQCTDPDAGTVLRGLTQKQIEEMPAGSEMDRLVTEALKWQVVLEAADIAPRYVYDGATLWQGRFSPSGSVDAAVAVIDFFEDVSIYREEYQYTVDIVVAPRYYGHGNAKRLPLAICRAVLMGFWQKQMANES